MGPAPDRAPASIPCRGPDHPTGRIAGEPAGAPSAVRQVCVRFGQDAADAGSSPCPGRIIHQGDLEGSPASLAFCSHLATVVGMPIRVAQYIGANERNRFDDWFRRLDPQTRARIQTRIDRIELGSFGDYRSVGQGVFEFRIHFGPGYRVYFGRDGDTLVVLLGGGSKRRQASDVARAQADWKACKREK